MTFDEWWATLTPAEHKLIGENNAKFVWDAATTHEREACAKRLDAVGCDHCAANIRARGQA